MISNYLFHQILGEITAKYPEIELMILRNLEIGDIVQYGLCCQQLSPVLLKNAIWENLYNRDFSEYILDEASLKNDSNYTKQYKRSYIVIQTRKLLGDAVFHYVKCGQIDATLIIYECLHPDIMWLRQMIYSYNPKYDKNNIYPIQKSLSWINLMNHIWSQIL